MKIKLFLFLFSLFFFVFAIAQTRQVNGRVTKENGAEPLTYVTVTVKGGTASTTTDTSGRFTITVPNNNSVLTFSSVGFTNTEVAVGNRSTLEVTMPQLSAT